MIMVWQDIPMTRQFIYSNMTAAEQLRLLCRHLMIIKWFSCDETQ
jgi:hypothetical protein